MGTGNLKLETGCWIGIGFSFLLVADYCFSHSNTSVHFTRFSHFSHIRSLIAKQQARLSGNNVHSSRIRPERFRDGDTPVFLLIVFENRHQGPAYSQA